MKIVYCERCGANEWTTQNGFRTCKYCGSKYQLTSDDVVVKESNIGVNSDVERLLKKCRLEPQNARKYANLILDIDPNNTEALKYL